MKFKEIKLTIIKKIRDIYFLIRFGKGKFLIIYIFTFLSHLIYNKKLFFEYKNINFTNNWFSQNISYIDFLLNNKKNHINKILEIGSFEGQSALFFLNYFNNSKITCVDIWQNQTDNYKNIKFIDVEKNFNQNLKNYQNKVKKFKGTSKHFFKRNVFKDYDFIFIDGSHYLNHVYQDAINSFNNLKLNGYILFDDYLFKYKAKKDSHPIFAINKFLKRYNKKIKIIAIYRQVLIQKISN